MKITKKQLKQIIKEEIQEAMYGAGEHAGRKIGMQDVGRQRYDPKTEAPPDIARTWIRAIEKEMEKAPTAGFENWDDDYRYYLFKKGSVLTDFEHSMRGWDNTYWADRAKAARKTGEALFTDAGEMPDKRSANWIRGMDDDGWPRVPEDANPVPDSVYKPGVFPLEQRYKFVPPSEDLEGRPPGGAPEGEYDNPFNESVIKRIVKEELKRFLKNK